MPRSSKALPSPSNVKAIETIGMGNGGASTETGDAYWTWEPIEYVPTPAPKSFTELVPDEVKQVEAVQAALDSFGTPDSPAVKARVLEAWKEVMEPTAAGGHESSARGESPK